MRARGVALAAVSAIGLPTAQATEPEPDIGSMVGFRASPKASQVFPG